MALNKKQKITIPFIIVLFLVVSSCQSNGSSDLSGLHDNVHKLTDSTSPQTDMTWSRDVQTIYYQQDNRICAMDIESDILYSIADGFHPTVSNDSQELYFLKSTVAYEAGAWQGELKAFVLDQNTHDITLIDTITYPFSGAEHAVWSPNGEYVALYVSEETQVQYLENGTVVDKTSTQRLAIWNAITGEINVIPYLCPRSHILQWNPDGENLVTYGYTDEEKARSYLNGISPDLGIWKVDATSRLISKVTTDPHEIDFASWSPEGSRLAFSTTSYDMDMKQIVRTIWTIEADGSDKKLLVSTPIISGTFFDGCFDWGPDEASIAFITYDIYWDDDNNLTNQTMQNIWIKNIYEMSEDLSLKTPFLHGYISDIDWSPDGATIALQYHRMRDDIVENQLIIDHENPNIYLLDVN